MAIRNETQQKNRILSRSTVGTGQKARKDAKESPMPSLQKKLDRASSSKRYNHLTRRDSEEVCPYQGHPDIVAYKTSGYKPKGFR
jgi:hypothetical protein